MALVLVGRAEKRLEKKTVGESVQTDPQKDARGGALRIFPRRVEAENPDRKRTVGLCRQ